MKSSASRRDVAMMKKLAQIEGMTNARISKRLRIEEATVAKFLNDNGKVNRLEAKAEAPAETESPAPAEEKLTPQQKAAITRKKNAEAAAAEAAEGDDAE